MYCLSPVALFFVTLRQSTQTESKSHGSQQLTNFLSISFRTEIYTTEN